MGGFSLCLLVAGLASPFVGAAMDRYGGHVVMTVGSLVSALGLVGLVLCGARRGLSRGVDAARSRARGVALRSGVRHAGAHLRRGGAPADHRAHAGRRLRLDGGLAGHASADRLARLARHISGLCRAAGLDLRAAPRLRVAAQPRRRGAGAERRRRKAAAAAAAARPRLPAGRRGLRQLRLRAVGAVRASARDLRPQRHRCRDRGADRRAVRAGAGRGAADRIPVRPRRPSADAGAVRGLAAGRGLRDARDARHIGRRPPPPSR